MSIGLALRAHVAPWATWATMSQRRAIARKGPIVSNIGRSIMTGPMGQPFASVVIPGKRFAWRCLKGARASRRDLVETRRAKRDTLCGPGSGLKEATRSGACAIMLNV
jgi:hypothetical protein